MGAAAPVLQGTDARWGAALPRESDDTEVVPLCVRWALCSLLLVGRDFGGELGDGGFDACRGGLEVLATCDEALEHWCVDDHIGPPVVDVVQEHVEICFEQSYEMVGRGGVFSDEPVAKDGGQFALRAVVEGDWAGHGELHDIEQAAIGQFHRHDFAGLNCPSLSGQADLGAVDAALFCACEDDLAVDVVAHAVGVEFFGEFGIGGQDDFFGFGDWLFAAPHTEKLAGKLHDDAGLGFRRCGISP